MVATEHEEPEIPENLDAEEESPFLRRQRPFSVRRKRVSRRWRWVLFGSLALVLLGALGYWAAVFALTSPRFRLLSTDDVVVLGNRYVSREEILSALALPLGGRVEVGNNVFRISLEDKQKVVESIPWVRSATLTRVLPNRLTVQVAEREPVAFVNVGGRVGLVDADGIILEKPQKASFDFPVLTGLDSAPNVEARRARIAVYQQFMREVAEELPHAGWSVSEIDLADADDLKALLVQGNETLQVHFGHKNFPERFQSFVLLLPELRRSNMKLDSVDLRYRNQIVVDPQGMPPASGERERPETPVGSVKD
jgi:cell division protein FtsQ